ncbi:MAG: pilus assembly protein PilM [Deltaproteobacteria bacterium]
MKRPALFQGWMHRERPTLGLDIGSHSIKLVEFAGGPSNRTLRRIGRAIVPPGAIVDGSIRDGEAISGTLKGLLKNIQPKLRDATISISGYSVIVKKVALPYTDEKEIEANLVLEAEKYVPFEIEDVYIDFHLLSGAAEGRPGSEIFLVAAKREVVDSYAALVQSVGLAPAVVDVDVFALGNAFEGAYEATSGTVVLVDIGAQKTNFNIVCEGTSIFTRDMAIGGNQLTEAIHEATGLDLSEAERVKIAGTDDTALVREISACCTETCTQWGAEIKKAIDFHNANAAPSERPRHIILSGGAALMKGLDGIIEKETELPVRIFNPFARYSIDNGIDPDYVQEIAPQMAIATGLALRMKK